MTHKNKMLDSLSDLLRAMSNAKKKSPTLVCSVQKLVHLTAFFQIKTSIEGGTKKHKAGIFPAQSDP